MKNLIVLSLIIIATLSCSKEDDSVSKSTSSNKSSINTSNCSYQVTISQDQYYSDASDSFSIDSISIQNNCLNIKYSSAGCNGNSWEIKLIDANEILESNPPQRNLRFTLKNKEQCDAFFTKEASFDISNLQVEGKEIRLNMLNSEQSILYRY